MMLTPRPVRGRTRTLVLGLVLALALAVGVTTAQAQAAWPGQVLRGITIESSTDKPAAEVIQAVAALSSDPMVRLVLDKDDTPEDWRALVNGLDPHAQIMMQVLDSSQMRLLSADQVRQRTQAFVAAFGHQVEVWEIGNELNGGWVGSSPAEINAKVEAAAQVVEAAGGRTAITLNYWSSHNCYGPDWAETRSYARTIPDQVMANLDLLLLSVYETACSPAQHPTADELAATLADIGTEAPGASLGIGEIGAQGQDDGVPEPDLAEKRRVAQRYMSMQPTLSARLGKRFVGGWFWWYFVRDAVPYGAPGSLWPDLNRLLAGL